MKHNLFVLAFVGVLAGLEAQTPAPAAASPLKQLGSSFADVFEKVSPGVVIIESARAANLPVSGLPQGLEFFLQHPDGRPVLEQPNIGSGVVFRADGHILTNHHVVEGAEKITVKLKDGRKFDAEIIGSDPRSDLAVIKIAGSDFPTAELGDSDAVRVGEFAFAIGTPLDLPYTFTVGVVSAKGRNLEIGGGYDFIQTDASINPGNSGGPLCDIDGRVIGINTLISGTNRGLGFSIPINTAKRIATQLVDRGRVTRPWLGIVIIGLSEAAQLQARFPNLTKGVVVRSIESGAPAESSDLRSGDVILRVDGREVSAASDLQHEILAKAIGDTVSLDVWRSGRIVKMDVRTGEQPDPFVRASVRAQRPPQAAPVQPPQVTRPSTPGFTYRTATQEALREFGLSRPAPGGVVVTSVEPGSAAAAAGIEQGDIITDAGGRPLNNQEELAAVLKDLDPERGLLLLIDRGGQRSFAILKP